MIISVLSSITHLECRTYYSIKSCNKFRYCNFQTTKYISELTCYKGTCIKL